MSLIPGDELLNLEQSCKLLDIAPRTLFRWMAQGTGPARVMLGPRKMFFRRSSLVTWAQSREEQPGEFSRKPVANHRSTPIVTAPAVSRTRNRRREARSRRRVA